jgi:hypothetical protein
MCSNVFFILLRAISKIPGPRNMSVVLPFDVLHTVIEMLANDEPPAFETMRSVSQTCRYLLPVCRKHLFSAIWLKSRIYGSDVANQAHRRAGKFEATLHIGTTNLAKLIASSPEIAGYVRELVFYPHLSNWIDETILPLLQKFDRLQKLHIRHQRDKEPWKRFESWDSLDDALQVAMVNLIHQQRHTLTHLYFTDYLNIPMSIIHPLTCLHTFHLIDSNMSTAVIADPPAVCHPRPLRLQSLAFTVSYSAIKGLLEGIRPGVGLPFFDLSQLQTFAATTSSTGTMVDEAVPIIRLLGGMSQLTVLDISVQRKQPRFTKS